LQADLEFRSQPYTAAELAKLVKGEIKTIDGTLKIGGKEFPVQFEALGVEGSRLVGVLKTTFTRFEIDPPAVVGGVVAQVRDKLELWFQLGI
jgi:hypothetical protein